MCEPHQGLDVPPKHVEVLVIGGGPAGSYAASVLSREGIDVVVLESTKFPRALSQKFSTAFYPIGESLIPSVRPYLRFIGAEEKVANYGFTKKPGSAIKFNQFKREGYTDFVALGADNNAWNVIRSEFDQLLLNHAQGCGAEVYEETKATSISFDPKDPDKPVSVSWARTFTENPNESQVGMSKTVHGSITFTHLIDASGRAGLLSTNYLKNRHFNASLRNIAVWGYWRSRICYEGSNNEHDLLNDGQEGYSHGCHAHFGMYGIGTSREGAPWFEALTDESGWAWFIPLHNGKTSVGIVMNQERYNTQAKSRPLYSETPRESSLVSRYLSNLHLAPGVIRLLCGEDVCHLANAMPSSEQNPVEEQKLHMQAELEQGSVRSASDFSYSAPSYAGKGFRIIGDAGAFIDPFFSSGIHLAFTGALSAAATICASRRGDCTEAEAAMWHTKRVAVSYTRFQVVVLSAYKQMRAQRVDVLSDVDEDNFDRAFTYLRPVIQGASDMGSRLSESELQRSLDFCVNLFNPTSPEEHEAVEGRLSHLGEHRGLMDVAKPVIDPKTFENVLNVRNVRNYPNATSCTEEGVDLKNNAESELKSRMVLDKINARRLVHHEYAINNLEAEELLGYAVRLERGQLGLVKVACK
ncbi:FAD binding domain-containing protein [Lentinula aff. detonsa]|uniref:FAD binding domain-containing protein n=1 Tax=Lentinula aff. detonsa TaxID=2804958 RepID=A0AA38KPZ8_9AGAR|nr:FAD binding domain-containing protein [Lentinula aff. detonsa]KAJ3795428.1 FAD binding domain-containing protein [Lentinula aff. detonsa]